MHDCMWHVNYNRAYHVDGVVSLYKVLVLKKRKNQRV